MDSAWTTEDVQWLAYYYNINFMILRLILLKYTYTKISYNFGINLNVL